jgi:serine/threonine-protein kinase
MTDDLVSPEFLLLQSRVAGRYSVVRELGRGGMGVVFLAREVALDRLVAIKMLPPSLASRPGFRESFLREARTAAQLAHPNIVSIHAVESGEDITYFVMEFIEGETLGARLRRTGALPVEDAMRVTQEVAWALAHAHARGVIHRDIKPDNILLEEGSDRAIVTDFGIARAGESSGNTPSAGMGTLHYMSPEQAQGAPVDARADVYALGVTAYHTVTGRRPFEGYDGAALLAQQSHGVAPPVIEFAPTIPVRFAAAIDRAILADPEARWPGVEQLARDLAEVRGAQPALSVPLRGFARVAREQMGRGAMSLGLALVTELVLIVAFGFDDFAGVVFHAMASLLVGLAGMSLAGIVVAARDLLRRGYGHPAAMLAIRNEVEEFYALPESMRRGDWRQSPSVVLLVGALIVAGAVGLVKASDSLLLGLSAVLIAIYTPMIVVQRLQRSRGFLKGWWAKAMNGWFGRLVFRVAALGLGDRAATPTSGEPTAIALGGAVQALYARLGEPQRKALSAIPDLISRLEAMALDRANPQSIQAVMALETLRMDLLRLRAGDVAAESITVELEKLREVGYRVDAEVEVRGDPSLRTG